MSLSSRVPSQDAIDNSSGSIRISDNADNDNELFLSQPKLPNISLRTYTLAVVLLSVSLLYADQGLLSPNLTAAARDFGFNDSERDWYMGALVALAFFMVGGPASISIGLLTDKVNRIKLLSIIMVLGEGPCFLTYFSTQYWELLLLRAITGVSIGGALPLVFSLLGDLFPPNQRALVSAGFGVASGVGLGAGQLVAGSLGDQYGWRLPFLVVSVPSLMLAILVIITIPEPPRARCEAALQQEFMEHGDYQFKSTFSISKIKTIFQTPTNILVFLQGIPGCVPWGVVFAYMNDYLAQDRGFSVIQATLLISLFGMGCITGGILGGIVGQFIYNKWKPGVALLMGSSTLLGTIPVIYLINIADPSAFQWGSTVAFFAGCIVCITGSNVRAVLLNVNPPDIRGTVFSIFTIFDDVGKGLGPFFAATLIAGMGRRNAFNTSVLAWVICGILLAAISYTIRHDEDAMQKALISQRQLDNHHDSTGGECELPEVV